MKGHLALGDDVLEQGQRGDARIHFLNSNSSTAAFTLLPNKSLPRLRAQHCQEWAWEQQILHGKLWNRDWARRAGNRAGSNRSGLPCEGQQEVLDEIIEKG